MSAACLVADSGPLIALARLDLLGLPARYFEPVLVTSLVWLEVTRKPGVDEAARLVFPARAGMNRRHHLEDLFGEIPVTLSDVLAWMLVVPGIPPTSPRFGYYVRNYNVIAKSRDAKRRAFSAASSRF